MKIGCAQSPHAAKHAPLSYQDAQVRHGLRSAGELLPQVRPPMPPAHLFLVDVSYQAVTTGLTAAACAAITAVLDDLQGLLPACWRRILFFYLAAGFASDVDVHCSCLQCHRLAADGIVWSLLCRATLLHL